MTVEPTFIVDSMLGKLAVRLRLLGFDAAFYGNVEDSFLLRLSRDEARVLLTRDLGLTRVRGANAVFLKSKKLEEQVREVIAHFDLEVSAAKLFTRCSICNEPLLNVSKASVKGKVPPRVFQNFEEFSYSPACGRYYWKGTHYEKLFRDLKGLINA